MPSIISATVESVSGIATEFTTTNRGFWLYGSKFTSLTEKAILMGVGADGEWEEKTNENGVIYVGAAPNTVYVDLPAGTYRINKSKTALAASVSYEVVV